jgi:hypothetical protein
MSLNEANANKFFDILGKLQTLSASELGHNFKKPADVKTEFKEAVSKLASEKNISFSEAVSELARVNPELAQSAYEAERE